MNDKGITSRGNFGFNRHTILAALAVIAVGCGEGVSVVGVAPDPDQPVDSELVNVGQAVQALTVPSGFTATNTWTGVTVYRKNYTGGTPDYVTVVDLRSGSVRSLTGSVTNAPSATLGRKLLGPGSGTFWSDAASQNSGARTARVVINGTFFSTAANPAPVAFGLRTGGVTLSQGYGLNEFPGLIRVFTFDTARSLASIAPHSTSVFTTQPDVIGALDVTANKSATSWVARTFVGVRDDDRDGTVERVLFYSSTYATQAWANNILTNFGASSVAMLDGGASTGLVIDGRAAITPGRTIPHAVAIYTGR